MRPGYAQSHALVWLGFGGGSERRGSPGQREAAGFGHRVLARGQTPSGSAGMSGLFEPRLVREGMAGLEMLKALALRACGKSLGDLNRSLKQGELLDLGLGPKPEAQPAGPGWRASFRRAVGEGMLSSRGLFTPLLLRKLHAIVGARKGETAARTEGIHPWEAWAFRRCRESWSRRRCWRTSSVSRRVASRSARV